MKELGNRPFSEYVGILRRRRWVIVLSLTSALLMALVGSFLVTPLYRATVTLQIERQNPDILNIRDLAKLDHSWAAYSDFYQTQYKVIGSMDVARLAVERAGLLSHPAFETEPSEPGLLARLRSLLPQKTVPAEWDPVDVAAAGLLARLEVSPVRNSQLTRVSWTSDDPELAAHVASSIADAYIQFTLESQFNTTDQARDFLIDQIGTLKREIVAIEERLQEYGESKGIVSIDEANNITLQALEDIGDERTAAQTKLARAQARFDAVREASPEALPEVLESDLIVRLRQEYAAYEAQYSERSRRFREDWPGMQNLRSKLEAARERLDVETARIAQQVRASAASQYRAARTEVDNLDRLLRDQEGAAQRLKRDAVEYANLDSEVGKKREALAALLQRQNEMSLSTRLRDLADTGSNIRVMERARVPTAPIRPRTRLNLVLGALFGLTLGVAMTFLLDYLDNTLKTVSELERVAPDFPLLGVIPRHEPATGAGRRRRTAEAAPPGVDLIVQRDPRAGISEAYRGLRTAILLSHPGQPPRQLMITSAVPEEGKTATAINLSTVLAQLGRRVVVVGADLRRPRLHKALGADSSRGASTYLSGLCDDPLSLVVPTRVENLDVLPSGPIPPNPSELLDSEIFASLGPRLLEGGYDHVIFDSPPLLSVSDPAIIANRVDMAILVVRAGHTPKHWVRNACEQLARARKGPSGIVFNGVETERHGALYRYEPYGSYEDDGKKGSRPERPPARAASS